MPIGSLLAHQGGWDEFLMVATPIGLFVLLLRAASRRAAAQEAIEAAEPTADPPSDDPVGSERAEQRNSDR